MLTAMEYRREGGNEKRKKKKKKRKSDVQIVNSISISLMDNNEKPKTKCEEVAKIVSSWKAPGLKTLGRLLITSFGKNVKIAPETQAKKKLRGNNSKFASK